jgi:predicted RNA binding protein YcfA (HicA-like mRNA interferase family)
MASVPSLSGSAVVAALKKHGFGLDRVRGSHHVMRHADGRGTTVPVHPGRDVAKGTLRSILSDVGMTPEQLMNPKRERGRELTPQEVNQGVANARGAVNPNASHPRSGSRRASSRRVQERDERSPR